MRTEEGWDLKAESREGDPHILTSSHPRGCWGRGRIHGEAGGRAEGCTSLLPGRRPVSDPFPPGNQLSVKEHLAGSPGTQVSGCHVFWVLVSTKWECLPFSPLWVVKRTKKRACLCEHWRSWGWGSTMKIKRHIVQTTREAGSNLHPSLHENSGKGRKAVCECLP